MHAALNGSVGAVRQLSSEIGAKSTDYCMMHPPGTTALMIAAAAGKTRIVEKLAAHESGIFDSCGNCALLLALQHGHRDCSLLLLSEARAFDADGKLCFTRLQESYQMRLDTGEPFVACYNSIREDLINMLFLSTERSFSTRLLAVLLSHNEYHGLSRTAPHLLDLLWASILGESETALDELDNYLYELEESHSENACIVCMSRQPDCVLLPCRHLSICSSCADRVYTAGSIWKCTYCRTIVENMFALEELEL